jgi:hypothetical protein
MACTSAPEDGAEVYLCRLGCVAARRAGRAVGGAIEGGVVDVVCAAGGALVGGAVAGGSGASTAGRARAAGGAVAVKMSFMLQLSDKIKIFPPQAVQWDWWMNQWGTGMQGRRKRRRRTDIRCDREMG